MDTIFQVFVIYLAATIAAEIVRPLRQPAIVAELAAGVVFGPHLVGWIHVNEATTVLASLGIVVLMFTVGLELRVSDIRTVGAPALGASITSVLVTAGSAFAVIALFGRPTGVAATAAIAMAATSAGIGARMLVEFDAVRTRAGRTVLGAAVIDDVVVLIALSLVLTRGTSQSGASIAVSAIAAVGFIGLVASIGPWLARRHGSLLGSELLRQPPFVFALALCLGLAALSEKIGLAALVGAFLAGMVLAETKDELALDKAMHPIYEFLVPFFFVISGARVDPTALRRVGVLFALVLIVATIASKVVGGAVGAVGLRREERLFVGASLVPRGEVTVAAASTALASASIDRTLYALLLSVVFVTTVLSPLFVRPLVKRVKS